MTPTLAHLLATLDGVPDPAWCEGVATATTPPAIEVAGARCATGDPDLVAWLLARSQDAPFGDRRETRLDPAVRTTKRLVARGATVIHGLDLPAIVGAVEHAFATDHRLAATLADVLVYPVGGRFARHKDTPRHAAQVGTLIIGLPVAHTGGAFTLTDGRDTHVVDWSGPIADGTLRWVAMFGDVDHAIARVTAGARVTLVYTLSSTQEPLRSANRAAALDAVADAMISVLADPAALPAGGELLVPCSRLIVAPAEAAQPLGLDVLRGVDRALADTLVRCGVRVGVRECLVPTETDDKRPAFPQDLSDAMLLARTIPMSVLASGAEAMTFAHEGDGDYLEPDTVVTCLGPYLADGVSEDAWLVRRAARATVVYAGMFSHTGYFGNECNDAFVYALAALEITLDPHAERVG